MILIYTHQQTNRLEYILDFIFRELCGIEFTVTHSREEFSSTGDARINYSREDFTAAFWIPQSELLFESEIKDHKIQVASLKDFKILFPAKDFIADENNHAYPFDIFAASFYLLTRYEEYLPHEKDMYGRYAHTNSTAFKEDFLQLPLINLWAKHFANSLQEKYPSISFKFPEFSFIPTYDIDIAFAHKGKGLLRNAGGILKSAAKGNTQTLASGTKTLLLNEQDPFDVYEELDKLHEKFQVEPVYFFLVAAKNGLYDKNILPSKTSLQQLIKATAEKYGIGLHPSWQSGDAGEFLSKEKATLEKISGKNIDTSRQHYIRFDLPNGYRRLIDAGISNDHSMGYGSINGFRASVASPHYWFDLEKNEVTNLRIFPFCYMEANSFYEQKYSAAQAYDEMIRYYDVCKSVGGCMVTIWHNHMLGRDNLFAGWKEVYVRFLLSLSY